MVSINQKGVFLCSQAVARHMIKQKNGVIVNMSSEAGMQGSKGQSCYSGTKGAVLSYTMSWAKELGPFNIRVVGVAPSINERTPMNDDAAFAALAIQEDKILIMFLLIMKKSFQWEELEN